MASPYHVETPASVGQHLMCSHRSMESECVDTLHLLGVLYSWCYTCVYRGYSCYTSCRNSYAGPRRCTGCGALEQQLYSVIHRYHRDTEGDTVTHALPLPTHTVDTSYVALQ